MTEWGQGCADSRSRFDLSDPSTFSECTAIQDEADKHFISWTDWYMGEGLNGQWFDSDEAIWTVFSRPYARAVAGTPKSMTFDWDTKVFNFCFVPDLDKLGEKGSTEVFVGFSRLYPQGYTVSTSGSIEVEKVDESNNLIYVKGKKSAGSGLRKESCLTLAPQA